VIDPIGFATPWVIYAVVLALHLLLPAQRVSGYVVDARTGEPLRYRLNALPVALVTIALWITACRFGVIPWDWLWTQRWSSLAGATTIGLLFSFAIVLTAPSTGRSLLADFYFGRRENPQALGGRLDIKMFLYLVGATMLALNLLSFAAHHLLRYDGDVSVGVIVHVALFSWFLLDYLFFERVHLYTYDLFAERVGFKLGFGCLTFYPYFYAVGLWATADRPSPHAPTWLLALAVVLFFCGWMFARGANMQKFFFKLDPRHTFLGIFAPQVVGDGERALLCSGFWGIARHVNYLGELLMATGLALALGWPTAIGPWLYPLYYLALLVPRERDDHRRCATKYGALWDEYCRRVRWRIVPFIY
jgi:protein-S-isoprenylcysteine O-methyltransferase Ste14